MTVLLQNVTYYTGENNDFNNVPFILRVNIVIFPVVKNMFIAKTCVSYGKRYINGKKKKYVEKNKKALRSKLKI